MRWISHSDRRLSKLILEADLFDRMDSRGSGSEPNAAGSFSDASSDNTQKMQHANQQQQQNEHDHQRMQQSSQETRKLPQQALVEENTRLNEQVEELQRQLNILQQQNAEMAAANTQWKKGKKTKQNRRTAGNGKGSNQTPPRYSSSYGGNGGVGGGGVLLELPSTFRNKSGNTTENPRNPLCCGSRSRSQNSGRTGQQKDHQSISTNDDQDTIEPSFDLEAHQSAPGLHHRNALHPSSGMTATTAGTTAGSSYDHSLLGNKHLHNNSMDDSLSSEEEDDDDEDSSSPLTNSSCIEMGRTGRDGIVRTRTAANANGSTTDHQTHDHFQMSFFRSAVDRAGWLVGLLVFQSLSSFILAQNELLLQQHAVIVQFLTMLVGAGGNAGTSALRNRCFERTMNKAALSSHPAN